MFGADIEVAPRRFAQPRADYRRDDRVFARIISRV
jgi:hypothetical protein